MGAVNFVFRFEDHPEGAEFFAESLTDPENSTRLILSPVDFMALLFAMMSIAKRWDK